MPELPEVETIKNELSPTIIGHTIKDIEIIRPDAIAKPSPEEFKEKVVGHKVTGITRHGKYLFFHLDNSNDLLLMHMKLAGSLQVNPPEAKHTCAIIHLDNGTKILLIDPRHFARMWLEKSENAITDKLGPEPFDNDFTPENLAGILKKKNVAVKTVILDQSLIAGIGNMYADEALFDARIHPEKKANKLTKTEVKRLYDSIRKVLRKGIEYKGASVRDYFRPSGEKGRAHENFLVAHGKGAKCPGCEGTIERIVVGGRGTYICPKCQPKP